MTKKEKQETAAELGFDVGGTFVDLVLRLDDGREDSEKLLADVDKLTATIEASIGRLLSRNKIPGSSVNKVTGLGSRVTARLFEAKRLLRLSQDNVDLVGGCQIKCGFNAEGRIIGQLRH